MHILKFRELQVFPLITIKSISFNKFSLINYWNKPNNLAIIKMNSFLQYKVCFLYQCAVWCVKIELIVVVICCMKYVLQHEIMNEC